MKYFELPKKYDVSRGLYVTCQTNRAPCLSIQWMRALCHFHVSCLRKRTLCLNTIEQYLVFVPHMGIRQRTREQLVKHNSVSVYVGVEWVRIGVLHSDNLRRLRNINNNKNMLHTSYATPLRSHLYFHGIHKPQKPSRLQLASTYLVTNPEGLQARYSQPKIYLQELLVRLSWKPTIHNIEPDGCSKFWFPLHLDLMVAKPKSPTFTVKSSWRKMSDTKLRMANKTTSTHSSSKTAVHWWERRLSLLIAFSCRWGLREFCHIKCFVEVDVRSYINWISFLMAWKVVKEISV